MLGTLDDWSGAAHVNNEVRVFLVEAGFELDGLNYGIDQRVNGADMSSVSFAGFMKADFQE